MTAMVRPISIYNTDFGYSRIALFLVLKVVLKELKVVKVHSKTKSIKKLA